MLKFAKHAGERSSSSLASTQSSASSQFNNTLRNPPENNKSISKHLQDNQNTSDNNNHSTFDNSHDKMMTRSKSSGHVRCSSFDQSQHYKIKQTLDITYPFYKPPVDSTSDVSIPSNISDDSIQNICIEAKSSKIFSTTKRRRRKSLSSLSSLKKQSAKKVQRTISNEEQYAVTLSPLDINESYTSPRINQKINHIDKELQRHESVNNELETENLNKENENIESKHRAKTIPFMKEKNLDYSTKRSKSWKSRFNSFFSKSNNSQGDIMKSVNNETEKEEKRTDLFSLTDGLLVKILSYFDTDDLCIVAKTCRRLNRLHLTSTLWKSIILRHSYANTNHVLRNIFLKLNHHRNSSLNTLQVQNIHLENTDITDLGLKELSLKCPLLNSLSLKNANSVTDIGIFCLLENCPNITGLSFFNCAKLLFEFEKLYQQINHSTRNLTDMKVFNCRNCPIDGRGLSAFLRKANNLETLHLRNCENFVDDDVINLIKSTSKLKHISIRDCPKISDKSIGYIFQNCVHLRSITLRHCNITDKCFRLFNSNLSSSLTFVDFENCRQITDFGLKSLVAICANITSLNLSGCIMVTDETLYNVTFLKHLQILKLRGCDKVKDGGIRHMAAKIKKLRHLDIRLCHVSTETCSYVKRKCIDCNVYVDKVVYC